jgi:hypothetical protein
MGLFPLVCVASLVCAACSAGPPVDSAKPVARPPAAAPSASAAAPESLRPSDIAARALPSVVAIRSKRSLGSGFIVRSEGWIATNLHVLAEADAEMKIVLKNGTELKVVSIIAIDPDRDLALIGVEAKDLPELPLGDSAKVRAGDPVVAIGHPLGLEDTVSDGLVSAVREVDPRLTVLQISAPIAPGSSGGPLFDDKGRVIGIATALSREGQNLAFGVPSAYLAELMKNPEPVSWSDFVGKRQNLPAPPKRQIPKHDLALLNGCGEGDLRLLGQMIANAIEVGAPLYNQGNVEACFHIYDGAASSAERKLGAGCRGPKGALAAGRRRAAALKTASDQAWAMRDTFDGLIDVLDRKLSPAP